MKKILVILLFSLVALNANSKWTYVNGLDDFTDEKVQYVSYEDKDHKFQIRNIDGLLWFFITRKKSGNPYKLRWYNNDFTYKDTTVFFRVDKNDLYILDIGDRIKMDISLERTLNKPLKSRWAFINNKTIAFSKLSFSTFGKYQNKKSSFNEFITCDLYKGEYFKIKYETDSIEPEAFKIPLKGFKNAFEKTFDKKKLPKCK